MFLAAVIPGVLGLAGGVMASRDAKKQTQMQIDAQKEMNKPDPRVDNMLWGQPIRTLKPGVQPTYEMVDDGTGKPRRVQTNADSDFEMSQGGLMSQFRGLLDAPQSEAMKQFGDQSGQYLQQNGLGDMTAIRNASLGLMGGINAPQTAAAQFGSSPQAAGAQAAAGPQVQSFGAPVLWNKGETFNTPAAMQGAQAQAANPMQAAAVNAIPQMSAAMAQRAQVNAPAQNGVNLRGSFDSLINGEAGNNPYLTGAIQRGINQSSNAFGALQRDSTQNLLENVMPSIRGGAVIAGGYGGSRQGIAEGRALDSFAREQQRALSQFGQNNTDAAVTAQAGAYDADRNRQLSATQGLSAQQYGVAGQNASMAQQTNLANQAATMNANQANQQGGLAAALANAGYQQQAGLANQSNQQQANMANAGFNQQANATNYAGQLQTAQQNASNLQQANLANQAAGNNAAQFGAQQSQAASMANAQMGQQNNQFNANLGQNNSQFNAGLQQQTQMANLGNLQQTNLANLQAQMGTNQLNTNRAQTGMAGLSGLIGTAYQNAGNQDNWTINRASQVSGLLSPYLNKVATPTQPVYSNSSSAGLGGALMGMQMGQGLMNMFSGGGAGGIGGFTGQSGSPFTGPSAGSGILSGFPGQGY